MVSQKLFLAFLIYFLILGVTLSDLRYNLVLMKDSKPVESFETSNKEFRITQKEFVLMEETNYSVKVRSIRKNDDGDKFSEYSQAANFFVKKEIEQVLTRFIFHSGKFSPLFR